MFFAVAISGLIFTAHVDQLEFVTVYGERTVTKKWVVKSDTPDGFREVGYLDDSISNVRFDRRGNGGFITFAAKDGSVRRIRAKTFIRRDVLVDEEVLLRPSRKYVLFGIRPLGQADDFFVPIKAGVCIGVDPQRGNGN